MRDNSFDRTVERNYLQKWRFLILEYEEVKAGRSKQFKRVGDFYRYHGTCSQTFRKYYNRYLTGGRDDAASIDSRGDMAGVAITRTDMSAADLRAAAKRPADARQAARILAIAMVLDGFSREDAARLCGMDRQTLRDWVHRYNKAGLDGLAGRARSGRPARLSWVEQGKVATWAEEGADLARDGVVRFRRADLRNRIAAGFGADLHERSVGKLLRRLDFRHLSVRPQHPQSDPAAQEAFKKTSQT